VFAKEWAWPSTRRAAPLTVLAATLLLCASPAAARRPDLVVTKLSKAPKALVAGHRLKVRVTVANRGGKAGRSRLGLYLSPTSYWSSSAVALTGSKQVRRLRAHRRVRVKAKVRVPRDAPPARRFKLLACADARQAVEEAREGNNCRAAGKVIVVGGSSFNVIDAYVTLHRLSASKAVLYKLFAVFGDRRLPKRYRGDGSRVDGSSAVQTALARFQSLPARIRAQVQPFLLPPIYKGSFASRGRGGARMSQADPDDFDACSVRLSEWSSVVTDNGAARVWWRNSSDDAADARRLKRELDGNIWRYLTGVMGGHAPLPDGDKRCGGPDSKLDVYLWPTANPGNGITGPLGTCHKASPSWVAVHPKAPRGVLAHEFMHVLQNTFPLAGDCKTWHNLEDVAATWAEDRAYHFDQTEHHFNELVVAPISLFGYGDGEPGWAFMFSATQHESPAVVRRLFEMGATRADPLDALDAALPNGLEGAWPTFARDAWNRRLPPSALTQSFFNWDAWRVTPNVDPLDYHLKTRKWEGELPIELSGLTRQYYDLRFDNRNAREITFKDPSAVGEDPHLRTWAFFKIARKGWKSEDWTGRERVEFCRDDKAEDVRQVVLVQSTSKRPPPGAPKTVVTQTKKPKIQLQDSCGAKVVLHIHGTESLTITDPNCGLAFRSSSPGWRADIEFDIRSRFGTRADQSNMVGGSGSGSLSGVDGICDDPKPFSDQWELGSQGIETGSLEVKPIRGGGASVTLVLTPFFNKADGEGSWSPYFVLDASTDPDWCKGPHGTVSAKELKSRHITVPMSASCDRTVTSEATYHGIASASGTLEVRR
jgi:hypothetical protein